MIRPCGLSCILVLGAALAAGAAGTAVNESEPALPPNKRLVRREDQVQFVEVAEHTQDSNDESIHVQQPRAPRGYMDNVVPQCLAGTQPLVGRKTLPDHFITSSHGYAGRSRLATPGLWCGRNRQGEWLNWHFPSSRVLTTIITSGSSTHGRVELYKLLYRTPTTKWTTYPDPISGLDADGNYGAVVTQLLPAIRATEVRLSPLNWTISPCARIELGGCRMVDIGLTIGQMGTPGMPGLQGHKGPKGVKGVQGLQGDPGDDGPRGNQGPPGPAGPAATVGAFVDCVWGNWLTWTECPTSCGGGLQQRERGWDIYPQDDGLMCDGDDMQYRQCALDPCPGPVIHPAPMPTPAAMLAAMDSDAKHHSSKSHTLLESDLAPVVVRAAAWSFFGGLGLAGAWCAAWRARASLKV